MAFGQNNKTESDNLNKITTTNEDKEMKIIVHVEEPQKSKDLEEQRKIGNQESTHIEDKFLIHDQINGESTKININNALIGVKIFEGLSYGIGGIIGLAINKGKYNINHPKNKKVKLREV